MNEELQILYMDARLVRLATKRWQMTRDEVVQIFRKHHIYKYVEELWGLFHVEGDEAVLCDIEEYIDGKDI